MLTPSTAFGMVLVERLQASGKVKLSSEILPSRHGRLKTSSPLPKQASTRSLRRGWKRVPILSDRRGPTDSAGCKPGPMCMHAHLLDVHRSV